MIAISIYYYDGIRFNSIVTTVGNVHNTCVTTDIGQRMYHQIVEIWWNKICEYDIRYNIHGRRILNGNKTKNHISK